MTIGDSAVVDRRAMYVLLGRDGAFANQLGAVVRQSLSGDTTEYDKQPPRPERQRFWSIREVTMETADRARVVARLSYGSRQHTETFIMLRTPGPNGSGWSMVDLRFSEFTVY